MMKEMGEWRLRFEEAQAAERKAEPNRHHDPYHPSSWLLTVVIGDYFGAVQAVWEDVAVVPRVGEYIRTDNVIGRVEGVRWYGSRHVMVDLEIYGS